MAPVQGSSYKQWVAIASGDATMPEGFQRFIAAWELVVAWQRETNPTDTTDKTLLSNLKTALPQLNLPKDARWADAYAALAGVCPIEWMRGAEPSGSFANVDSCEDWAGIADALYAVRCNLLKAGKSPEVERDLKVCEAAAGAANLVAQRLWEAL